MTQAEELLYKLGLKLQYKDADMEVYINYQPGYDVEVAYFFPNELRITITAKFDNSELKISQEFPLFAPVKIRPEANYRDLKINIINTFNIFSNILVSKSNEFNSEVKRIEQIANTDFYS